MTFSNPAAPPDRLADYQREAAAVNAAAAHPTLPAASPAAQELARNIAHAHLAAAARGEA